MKFRHRLSIINKEKNAYRKFIINFCRKNKDKVYIGWRYDLVKMESDIQTWRCKLRWLKGECMMKIRKCKYD